VLKNFVINFQGMLDKSGWLVGEVDEKVKKSLFLKSLLFKSLFVKSLFF
jgi:hypothetical protein